MPEMTDAAIDMLHAYRKHCAASSSPGQLILPDSLKLLPLYLAVIGKLGAFNTNKLADTKSRPGAAQRSPFADVAVRADSRIAQLVHLNGIPANRIIPFVYPRLFVLHTMCGLVRA
jgi:protein transport protein SEC24